MNYMPYWEKDVESTIVLNTEKKLQDFLKHHAYLIAPELALGKVTTSFQIGIENELDLWIQLPPFEQNIFSITELKITSLAPNNVEQLIRYWQAAQNYGFNLAAKHYLVGFPSTNQDMFERAIQLAPRGMMIIVCLLGSDIPISLSYCSEKCTYIAYAEGLGRAPDYIMV